MSTRATYRFLTDGSTFEYRGALTLYIHHDGYPTGAAEYLAKMVAATLGPESRGGLVENFIRANERAELTAGHDAHGDTEFRYTVSVSHRIEEKAPEILVHSRAHGWGEAEPERWAVRFAGSLVDFLNQEKGDADAKGNDWATELRTSGGYKFYARHIVTMAWLTVQARQRIANVDHQLANGWTGNASSAAGELARFVGAGAEVSFAELVAVLRRACATCPHMVAYYLKEAGLPVELAELDLSAAEVTP